MYLVICPHAVAQFQARVKPLPSRKVRRILTMIAPEKWSDKRRTYRARWGEHKLTLVIRDDAIITVWRTHQFPEERYP